VVVVVVQRPEGEIMYTIVTDKIHRRRSVIEGSIGGKSSFQSYTGRLFIMGRSNEI
jgi:hypothetical protein